MAPHGSEICFNWNFGPAEAGSCTLTVPYAYEFLPEYDTDTGMRTSQDNWVDFSLRVPDMAETAVDLPYGTMTVKRLEPAERLVDAWSIRGDNEIVSAIGALCGRFNW